MILDQIAQKYGTDKASGGHNYMVAYEKEFNHLELSPISLLEIGVDHGQSMRMWQEYFPLGDIVGIDIDSRCEVYRDTRISIEIGDSNDKNFINHVVTKYGKFDVIIDDGCHLWESQISSFNDLWDSVKPGGIYVVEDLHTSYWDGWGVGPQSFIEYTANIIDVVNDYGNSKDRHSNSAPQRVSPPSNTNNMRNTIESVSFYKSIVFIKKSNLEEI